MLFFGRKILTVFLASQTLELMEQSTGENYGWLLELFGVSCTGPRKEKRKTVLFGASDKRSI